MEASDGAEFALDESYRSLPALYFWFWSIWLVSAFSWTLNTYKKRHSQTNNLQWALALVPLIKLLQLTLSFIFWYWCYNMEICSLWMSFGVYVSGVLFQTASLTSLMLISQGYSITCERLTARERRTLASLGCVLYLSLVGYKACVPYFSLLLLLNYAITFFLIFHHTSLNLSLLRHHLAFLHDDPTRHALYSKYTMYKKFRGAMQIVAVAEALIYINLDDSLENYGLRLLVREWAQLCIVFYIGWTFRSQDLAPRFSVTPTLKSNTPTIVPPIYSIKMDASTFKDFNTHEWHIGVASSWSSKTSKEPVIVIIQQPRSQMPNAV